MTLHGKIQNGVVILEENPGLAEGTAVTVVVESPAIESAKPQEQMSPEEHQRVLAIIDRIAALPLEGSAEPFSGADHDKVLYGKP